MKQLGHFALMGMHLILFAQRVLMEEEPGPQKSQEHRLIVRVEVLLRT